MKLIGYGKLEPPFPNLPSGPNRWKPAAAACLSFGQSGKVISFKKRLQVAGRDGRNEGV